jgi:hypothetical protein
MADLVSGLIVGTLWVVREIGALAIRGVAARWGRVGYVAEESSLVQSIVVADGQTREVVFNRSQGTETNDTTVYATYSGHLYNDSDMPLVLHSPHITYWGLDGPRIQHLSPECILNGKHSVMITVPAHDTAPIVLRAVIVADQLDRVYFGTIPILDVTTVKDRVMEFPLRTSSPYGGATVGWDSRNRRVVALGSREWTKAQFNGSLRSQIGRIKARP